MTWMVQKGCEKTDMFLLGREVQVGYLETKPSSWAKLAGSNKGHSPDARKKLPVHGFVQSWTPVLTFYVKCS